MFALPLLVATPALAVPSLAWEPGRPVHYFLETDIRFGESMLAPARLNHEVRVYATSMRAEATCTPAPLGKSTELTCTFSHLDFELEPNSGKSQAVADLVEADWEAYAATAEINIVLAADGHIKSFDIDGMERKTLKDGYLIEYYRALFMRLFAPLDLRMTSDEKDWIRGWTDKNIGYLLSLPTSTGTSGAGTVKHFAGAERFGLVQILSEGRGTVAQGAAVDSSTNGGLVDLRVAAEGWIDPEARTILFRGFSTDGQRLASSSAGTYEGFINQRSALQRVDAFNADHSPPISVLAQRAPQLSRATPAPPEGVALVDFASLGMQPLFIEGMPQVAQGYELPRSNVKALVVVDGDGKSESVDVYWGYEMLAEHVQRGLKDASFPARGGRYAVDVAVEVRP
ncbi:MAG: hypothetical protein FJ090_17260 [Deltaproteobacteria bacterium]|nr:hypothetical protein [Deltaproteobacteria bacterium]